MLLACIVGLHAGENPDEEPPGQPTNLGFGGGPEDEVPISWTDGTKGRPIETYTLRCFARGGETNCQAVDFFYQVTGIERGVQAATATLPSGADYTCFVLAVNAAAPDGIYSEGLGILRAG